MARDAKDTAEARAALERWIVDKPDAALVVAALDEDAKGEVSVALRLNAIDRYKLQALVYALIVEAIAMTEVVPGTGAELAALLEVQEILVQGPKRVPPAAKRRGGRARRR